MTNPLTPKETVEQLDRYIVGHSNAKKAVAIALRDRWRRTQLNDQALKEEILPKNILLIGTTGIGKTEMARRLAKMSKSPFLKIEATKFTEVGYVGRDVEQIIRDLVEIAIQQSRKNLREEYTELARDFAIQQIVREIKNQELSEKSEYEIKKEIQSGVWDETEIEINMSEGCGYDTFNTDDSGKVLQFGEWLNKTFSEKTMTTKMTVEEALEYFTDIEADKMLDQNHLISSALQNAEENGIVFIDEIDKICCSGRHKNSNSEVSREGVQRDLLPLVEGTTISTKHGNIKTDHILFIASGAFSMAKPTDLLPELQGRFPVKVEMEALTEDDFVKILTETELNLVKQISSLLETEKVEITFSNDAINKIAQLAVQINKEQENIGARRLHTLLEHIVQDISFEAPDLKEKKVIIDKDMIDLKTESLTKPPDLRKYIL